ncbi:MAG: TolC family protein [Deltaproteobacteria bacterium]|nr:TolC family protein [Deltaproteobacteria bacterium]
MKWISVAVVAVGLPIGCAQVVKERGHDQVDALVQQRSHFKTRWEKGPPDDARIASWVTQLSAGGLTRGKAVEIALVNNHELQSTYEELGIAQADMVQAGLLRNPAFGVNYGFATTTGAVSEVSFSLTQDFLDLFILPLRKEIAREQFEADTLRVTHQVMQTVADVEKAFVAAQASSELVAFRRTVVETTQAAADLSERQFEAGNVSTLDRSTERATFEQAKLDLARAEFELLESRERINRLLGLWGEATTWKLAEKLPEIPATEPKLEHLESLAIRQRFDVAAARRQAVLLAKAVGLARSSRLFGRIEIGVDAHRDPDGPRVIGPHLVIDLPIFDQRQAFIARLEAQQRQQERRLSGLAIEVRSDVRLADARLRGSRQTALHYRDVLLPLRKEVVEQAGLHYNGMFISLYQLLVAKQAEVEARRGYLESVRDYWSARADLAHAVGGGLPTAAPNHDSKVGKTPPAAKPQGTHQHGQ